MKLVFVVGVVVVELSAKKEDDVQADEAPDAPQELVTEDPGAIEQRERAHNPFLLATIALDQTQPRGDFRLPLPNLNQMVRAAGVHGRSTEADASKVPALKQASGNVADADSTSVGRRQTKIVHIGKKS